MAPQPFELCRILEEKSRQKSETDYDSILIELRNMMEGLVIELKDYLKSID